MNMLLHTAKKFGLIILFFVCPIGYAKEAKKSWTFLVYMAADNSFNLQANTEIENMKKVDSTDTVNVLVYLSTKDASQKKITRKIIIRTGIAQEVDSLTAQDSGDENTLADALQWATTEFPADYFLVSLWDHGTRDASRKIVCERGFCYDRSTGNHLTDLKCQRVFDTIVNQYRNGKKIDILVLDACLMANIELAYAFVPYVHYFIGSQQALGTTRFDYAEAISALKKRRNDPEDVVRETLGHHYVSSYKNNDKDTTLSATDMTQLPGVVDSLNQIALQLITLLHSDFAKAIKFAITSNGTPPKCQEFTEPTFIDLYTFYMSLYISIIKLKPQSDDLVILEELLIDGMKKIASAIPYSSRYKDIVRAHGLSIYFPNKKDGIEPSYCDLCWSRSNGAWLQMLNIVFQQTDSSDLDQLITMKRK